MRELDCVHLDQEDGILCYLKSRICKERTVSLHLGKCNKYKRSGGTYGFCGLEECDFKTQEIFIGCKRDGCLLYAPSPEEPPC